MKHLYSWTLSLVLLFGMAAFSQSTDAAKGKAKPDAGSEKKAQVSGKWSGTLEFSNASGESKSGPAYMILKQDGNKVSGSGGPNEGEQHPIQNGKVLDDK